MSSREVIDIIASLDGAFTGAAPGKQITVTPTSETETLYTLTKWRCSDAGDLVEVLAIERYRVVVEALPREECDPVPPPEPEPEPDPLTEAITTLDAQVPPEGDGTAEVSAPAARVVLTAARSLRE